MSAKEIWTSVEIIELFDVEEGFLAHLEEEEIIRSSPHGDPPEKGFSAAELEKLRLAKILVEEMGVNLEGVEVILRMRQCMLDMREQFDRILEDLAKQLEAAVHDDSRFGR